MNKKVILSFAVVAAFVAIGLYFWHDNGNTSELIHPTTKYAIWAAILGGISAISLPLGSLAGIIFKPRASITASLTAFGAGALMAALSVELIAPTVMEIVGQAESSTGMAHDKSHAFYTMGALLVGCILGGILFFVLDEALQRRAKKKQNPDAHGEEHSSGAMAIWLGLLIDGIPESFVIGAGFLTILSAKLAHGASPEFMDLVPFTLIAGLFLSNFPEALGSSMGMKKQGLSTGKILMLWFSLVILVAIGSTVGYYVGAEVPHEVEIGIEGLAAGAMLTMIAQTMIPEAVHVGGAKVVGLSTLIGYLAAVAFKLFE